MVVWREGGMVVWGEGGMVVWRGRIGCMGRGRNGCMEREEWLYERGRGCRSEASDGKRVG